MDESTFYALQVASTLSVVLPLGFALLVVRKHDYPSRIFLIYLAIGFAVDLGGWYFYLTRNSTGNEYLRYAYDLAEASFLFYLILLFSQQKLLRQLMRVGLAFLIPFWAMRFQVLEMAATYKTLTQLVVAAATAFLILKDVEASSTTLRTVRFWILLGMFFYTFSTFFFASVIISRQGEIWWIYNVLNITTNFMYLAGFIVARQQALKTDR